MYVKVIGSHRWEVFLRHGVYYYMLSSVMVFGQYLSNYSLLTSVQHIIGTLLAVLLYWCSLL